MPTHHLTNIACQAPSSPQSHWLTPLCWLSLLALCLVQLTGCSPGLQTWEQLTTRRFAAPVQHERLAARQAAGLPNERPLVWLANEDRYDWKKGYAKGDVAIAGDGFDLKMRHPDFPRTYISEVHINLTSPDHAVYVVWIGPLADNAPAGPWRSSPGQGSKKYDCNQYADSNTLNSNCTPKGVFRVKGFSDHLQIVTGCHYATWVIHKPRFIAMHSSGDIPPYPASGGCIRLDFEVAKLIHNNSITGVTLVGISGRWTKGGNVKK